MFYWVWWRRYHLYNFTCNRFWYYGFYPRHRNRIWLNDVNPLYRYVFDSLYFVGFLCDHLDPFNIVGLWLNPFLMRDRVRFRLNVFCVCDWNWIWLLLDKPNLKPILYLTLDKVQATPIQHILERLDLEEYILRISLLLEAAVGIPYNEKEWLEVPKG
jgi:hypothetical protein